MAIGNKEQWRYEMGYDNAPVILGDGSINVDGIMVSGSRMFVRDPRLSRLSDENYRPAYRRGSSRPEGIHVTTIPLDKDGRPMRFCSGGHYAPVGMFTNLKRNLLHGHRDGLDDTCSQCHKLRRARNRMTSSKVG